MSFEHVKRRFKDTKDTIEEQEGHPGGRYFRIIVRLGPPGSKPVVTREPISLEEWLEDQAEDVLDGYEDDEDG